MPHRTVIQKPSRPSAPKGTARQRREAARAAELGVSDPLDDARHPQHERHTGVKDVRHYPEAQYSPDALDMLGEEDITGAEFMRRRRDYRRVWEPVAPQPLVIDFTDVKQPLFPHTIPPQSSSSTHPDTQMYTDARVAAKHIHPGNTVEAEMARNVYYWGRIDAGTLPQRFNPYRPGTDKHEAFAQRVTLADDRERDPETQALMTARQVRRRAERKLARGLHLTDEELELLFKPLGEWDLEELKRGRPRGINGKFSGPVPQGFLRGEMKEKIREELTRRVRGNLDSLTIDATMAIGDILRNEDTDGRGRPVVPAGVKMRAAEFLVDHMLGKATQRVETDVSAKLMAVLGDVMVAPGAQLTQDGVVPTGMLHAGQRGQRQGYDDQTLQAVLASTMGTKLAIDNVVDAEWEETEDA